MWDAARATNSAARRRIAISALRPWDDAAAAVDRDSVRRTLALGGTAFLMLVLGVGINTIEVLTRSATTPAG